MAIFPLAADQIIAQTWSNGVRGGWAAAQQQTIMFINKH